MTARVSTRCAICGIPRADHGYTAVADREGNLGPWHRYTPTPTPRKDRHAQA